VSFIEKKEVPTSPKVKSDEGQDSRVWSRSDNIASVAILHHATCQSIPPTTFVPIRFPGNLGITFIWDDRLVIQSFPEPEGKRGIWLLAFGLAGDGSIFT